MAKPKGKEIKNNRIVKEKTLLDYLLVVYNLVSATGWGYCLYLLLNHLYVTNDYKTVYQTVGSQVFDIQSAMIIDVISFHLDSICRPRLGQVFSLDRCYSSWISIVSHWISQCI